jgi:hypothetical protein
MTHSPETSGRLDERLVQAGTGPDKEIDHLVQAVGLDAVVSALVAEIIFRCDAPVNTKPTNIALDITHRDDRRTVVLRVHRDAPIQIVADPDPVIWSRLGIDLTSLVRRLYGRTGHRLNGDFANSFIDPSPFPEGEFLELSEMVRSASQVTGTLMSGLVAYRGELGSLAVRYESDKWASFHWYTPHYERHFAGLRDTPVRLLEIGIGGYDNDLGGGSLKMWKRYFHRGLVFGLDVFDKTALSGPRLTALVGDQNNPDDLIAITKEHGPFDIIIDDGSHYSEHIRRSFDSLFPHLNDGGLYVIEDLQTAYFPSFGGSAGAIAEPHTSIGLIKQLLDDLHHQEREGAAGGKLTPTQSSVTGVHVYHNIVFIEKGVNGEAGLPPWMNAEAWAALGATDTDE